MRAAQVGLLVSAGLALAAAWGHADEYGAVHMAGFYWLIGIFFVVLSRGHDQ